MRQALERIRFDALVASVVVALAGAGLGACLPTHDAGGGGSTPIGGACVPYDVFGKPERGCYPVSCTDGFYFPSCGTGGFCGPGARCVPLQYLSWGHPVSVPVCMKVCKTDADCGRLGLLACDLRYHVCTDFQGAFLSGFGTFGGHAANGDACSTGTPPARSSLFAADVVASNPADAAASEVSLGLDPTTTPPTIYAAYNDSVLDPVTNALTYGSEIVRSEDGGATWKTLSVPDPENIGDPALAVDQHTGELYYAYIGGVGVCRVGDTFNGDNEIHLVWSTNHGDTLHGPVVVNTGAYADDPDVFMDKPQAVVGPEGDVYVTFDAIPVTQAPEVPSDIVLAYSTDHGRTFTDVRVNSSRQVPRSLSQPAVDEAGDLWVTWLETPVIGAPSPAHAGHVRIAESTNRGRTFGPSQVIDPGDEAADWPNSIAVSPDGSKIYVAYQARAPGKIDVFDVKVAYSLDGGTTWKTPVKVNDDATCATHWLPGIGLGPKGDVWVIWYDNRYGDERVFGAEGTLSGQSLSFGENFAVTDGGAGPFSTQRFFPTLSDYLGFATVGSFAVAGWANMAYRVNDISVRTRVHTSVATLPR